MKVNRSWFRRRFWDFRMGHGTYLAYTLNFINFIVITYTLLISNVPLLNNVFSHLLTYAIVFLLSYPSFAIIVGHIEFRKKQYPTDVEIATLQNPFLRKLLPGKEKEINFPAAILRFKIDLRLAEKNGLITLEEKREGERLIKLMEQLAKGETLQ